MGKDDWCRLGELLEKLLAEADEQSG